MTTIGEYLSDVLYNAVDKSLEFGYDHRYGLGAAFLFTVGNALYNGSLNPLDLKDLSHPNFVRPGEDTQWEMLMLGLGTTKSALDYYLSHKAYNAIALGLGCLADLGLTKIFSTEIKK